MSGSAPEVLVTGYASIDEALNVSHHAAAGETAIVSGPVRPASSPGGCGRNTATVLARLGVSVGLVTWVGDDAEGDAYRRELVAAGVDATGVERGSGGSPRSLLLYDADGSAACYFHPSGSASQRLTDTLRVQLAGAQWLAITVGPAVVNRAVLDAAHGARVAWNVKADADAFPPELVRRLVGAELVCLNEAELEFVARQLGNGTSADPEALLRAGAACVAVTRGSRGYRLVNDEGSIDGVANAVTVRDPTGSGDAFFAGLLAARMRGLPLAEAGQQAAAAVRDMLLERQQREGRQ